MFENRVLRRIFGGQGVQGAGGKTMGGGRGRRNTDGRTVLNATETGHYTYVYVMCALIKSNNS